MKKKLKNIKIIPLCIYKTIVNVIKVLTYFKVRTFLHMTRYFNDTSFSYFYVMFINNNRKEDKFERYIIVQIYKVMKEFFKNKRNVVNVFYIFIVMCVFLTLMGMLFSQDSNYFFPIYANEYVALFCYIGSDLFLVLSIVLWLTSWKCPHCGKKLYKHFISKSLNECPYCHRKKYF